MLKLNKKIKAFTIIELLMVMMLSGIVIGLTFLYFAQFRHYLQSTYKQEDSYSELYRFQFAIQKDIVFAQEIYAPSTDEILIRFANNEIKYLFDNSWVVRETQLATDTIKLKIFDVSFNIQPEYNNLVKSIDIELEAESDKSLLLSFTKEYSAATLFVNFKKQQ